MRQSPGPASPPVAMVAGLLAVLSLVAQADAQSLTTVQLVKQLPGVDAGDQYGFSVAAAGDANDDGFGDLLIGAPIAGTPNPFEGRVYLVSGADFTVLRTFVGTDPSPGGSACGDLFGTSVAGVGDLSGDGVGDLLVGAPEESPCGPSNGYANLFDAVTGLSIGSPLQASSTDDFGQSVSGGGDADVSGTPAVAIGDPTFGAGKAWVFLSSQLTIPQVTIIGASSGDHLGRSVSLTADLSGDGIADLVVGEPDFSGSGFLQEGRVRVFSASDGSVITATGTGGVLGSLSQLGTSVATVDDLGTDGKPDVLAGAPVESFGGVKPSVCLALEGDDATNVLLQTDSSATDERLGWSVAPAGDFDDDGTPDILMSAPLSDVVAVDAGRALLVSGVDGVTVLAELDPPSGTAMGSQFGYSVACAGDVNGDGLLDYLVGAPFADVPGTDSGAAYVFVTVPPPPPPSFPEPQSALVGRPGGPAIADLPVITSLTGDDFDLKPVVIVPKVTGSTIFAIESMSELTGLPFEGVGEFFSGNEPQKATTGEFTGDGIPDVAVVNRVDGNLVLFAGSSVYPGGSGPQVNLVPILPATPVSGIGELISVKTADLDLDGRDDLVVAGLLGVAPFTVTGNGIVSLKDMKAVSNVTAIDVGKLDGDLDDDVVVVTGTAGSTGDGFVLLNLGNGVLAVQPAFAKGSSTLASVVLADFVAGNGPDALVVEHKEDTTPPIDAHTGTIKLFVNNGSGVFSPSAAFQGFTVVDPDGIHPTYGAAGDVNNDNLPDAVYASSDNLDISFDPNDDVQPPLVVTVLVNNGAGGFATTVIGTSYVGKGVEPILRNLLTAPGDTITDIILVWSADQAAGAGSSGDSLQTFIAALVGDGAGGFQDPAPNQFGTGDEPGSGDAGNIDSAPGLEAPAVPAMDLVIPNAADNSLTVLLGDGSGGVSQTVTVPDVDDVQPGAGYTGGLRDARLAHLDADGHLDVIVYDEWLKTENPPWMRLSLLRGTGTGNFVAAQHVQLLRGGDFAPGDVSKDGLVDVVVALRQGATGASGLAVYPGIGNGTVQANSVFAALPQFVQSLTGGLVLADVDGDADLDALTTGLDAQPTGRIVVYRNSSPGSGQVAWLSGSSQTGTSWTAVASLLLGDIDSDGALDALVGVESGELVVAQGHGDGTFEIFGTNGAAAAAGGGAMAAGNLNGDVGAGLLPVLDLVCATGASTQQALVNELLGAGDGTFTVSPVGGLAATSGGGATRPLLVDMNGDEATDLVLVHGEANAVSILVNELAGFSPFPAGKPGTGGLAPVLAGKGYATLGGLMKLVITQGVGGAQGLLRLGVGPVTVGAVLPFASFLDLPIFLAGTPGQAGQGTFTLPAVIPNDPRFIGLVFHVQVLLHDPGNGIYPFPNYSLSNGLTISVPGGTSP